VYQVTAVSAVMFAPAALFATPTPEDVTEDFPTPRAVSWRLPVTQSSIWPLLMTSGTTASCWS